MSSDPFEGNGIPPELQADHELAEAAAALAPGGWKPGYDLFMDLVCEARKDANGNPVTIVEWSCARCHSKMLRSEAESLPPPGKPVPLCGNCLKVGERVVLTRKTYGSGPCLTIIQDGG